MQVRYQAALHADKTEIIARQTGLIGEQIANFQQFLAQGKLRLR